MTQIDVREFESAEWRLYRELRLRALSESPWAFGSTLAREEVFADQWWIDRLTQGVDSETELPLLALKEDNPAGLCWGRIEPERPQFAQVYQVWVAPEARGCGAGGLFMKSVIAWAQRQRVEAIELTVTCGDTPARRLYERHGFLAFGEPVPLRPGSETLEQPMRLLLCYDGRN